MLQSNNYLGCNQLPSRLLSNNQIYIQSVKLRRCSNQSTINRQSLTATDKQVGVARLFD